MMHGPVYASRDASASQLRKLVQDIKDVLDENTPAPEQMQHGDLGLTEPEDIPF